MTREEKLQAKQHKAEAKRRAKEERKQIINEIMAKKKAMKKERTRILHLYAQKQIDLKHKLRADKHAAGNNRQQIKLLKQQYKKDLWDLHNQRDYAVANYYLNDKTKRKQKMIVDKRIAYKEYNAQYEILHENTKKELATIKKEHKDNVANLKKQYRTKQERKLMKQYKKEIAPFKKELKSESAIIKKEHKRSANWVKVTYKVQSERVLQLDKTRQEYEKKLDTIKQNYEDKCLAVRVRLNIKYDLKTLNTMLIDESNNYQTKYIQAKVNFKNKNIQLKQKRDLSYDYELDAGFTLRRWFFGVGKEFQRMSWPGPKKTVRDLLIVLAITLFLAVVFLIIDVILNAAHIM